MAVEQTLDNSVLTTAYEDSGKFAAGTAACIAPDESDGSVDDCLPTATPAYKGGDSWSAVHWQHYKGEPKTLKHSRCQEAAEAAITIDEGMDLTQVVVQSSSKLGCTCAPCNTLVEPRACYVHFFKHLFWG